MNTAQVKALCHAWAAAEQQMTVLERLERQLTQLDKIEISGSDPLWRTARRYELKEQQLYAQSMMIKLQRQKAMLEHMIRSAPDVQLQQILELRCKRKYQWEQIAQRLGGGNTGDGVRKRAARYWKSIDMKDII